MAIGIDKILTISAREYVDMEGRLLRDYKAVGVHAYSSSSDIEKSFAKLVTDEAEVVVGYRVSSTRSEEHNSWSNAYGTALIRMPAEERRPIGEEEPSALEPFTLRD